jgi:hypothetical protein
MYIANIILKLKNGELYNLEENCEDIYDLEFDNKDIVWFTVTMEHKTFLSYEGKVIDIVEDEDGYYSLIVDYETMELLKINTAI